MGPKRISNAKKPIVKITDQDYNNAIMNDTIDPDALNEQLRLAYIEDVQPASQEIVSEKVDEIDQLFGQTPADLIDAETIASSSEILSQHSNNNNIEKGLETNNSVLEEDQNVDNLEAQFVDASSDYQQESQAKQGDSFANKIPSSISEYYNIPAQAPLTLLIENMMNEMKTMKAKILSLEAKNESIVREFREFKTACELNHLSINSRLDILTRRPLPSGISGLTQSQSVRRSLEPTISNSNKGMSTVITSKKKKNIVLPEF